MYNRHDLWPFCVATDKRMFCFRRNGPEVTHQMWIEDAEAFHWSVPEAYRRGEA